MKFSTRPKNMSTVWLGVALAVAFATGASGCKKPTTNEAQAADAERPAVTSQGVTVSTMPVHIGIVGSLTGAQKPWGQDSLDGAKLALADFIKANPDFKGKIVLDAQDSQSQAQGADQAAVKLISQGDIALLGEVSSGNTQPMAKRAYAAGIPDVVIGGTNPDLTKIGKNVFRVCYTDNLQGPVMAKFCYDKGLRRMAIMTDERQPYSKGLSKTFKEEFLKLGGQIVDEESYQTGDINFTPQLTQLKAKEPQGIFASGYFPEVGPIVAAAKQMGINVPFFGGDGWDSPKILDSGGPAIIGDYMCNHYSNQEKRPEVQAFLTEWKATHNGAIPGTTMGALGYDAMMVTLDALKTLKPPYSSLDLIKAISQTDGYKGVAGDITLKGQHGDPPKRVLVVQLHSMADGFQVPVKAYTPADLGQ